MKSETVTIQQIFQVNRQYRVPFYQRTYVWNKEDQWERLWTDIQDKASERLLGGQPVPHFLGAVVLEPQPRQGILGIEEVYIIDGQQRLTTLQYVLASLAMILRSAGETALLSLVSVCQRNSNPETMRDKEAEVFKLRPTFRDRKAHELAISAETLTELNIIRFPEDLNHTRRTQKARSGYPSAVEAIRYFHEELISWVTRERLNIPQSRILTAVIEAVLCDFKLVSITLGEEDDAQVIFETLNGHGAQLHATDLIRNFIFMRADRESNDADRLYESLWVPFEDSFWTEEQTRGRLKRHRLEWFMQTALQAEFNEEVDISRLYASYRRFAATTSAHNQLRILTDYANNYRLLILGEGNSPIARFGRRIRAWDASTSHPLALLIAKSGATDQEQNQMFDYIVSYFVRRAICGLTMKNYNRVFNQQIKRFARYKITAESLYTDLSSLEGKAARWPRDDEFQKAWMETELYRGNLDTPKIKAVLTELEINMRSTRTEEPNPVELESLDVEHVLPVNWFEHWALPDGTYAHVDEIRRLNLSDHVPPPRIAAIVRRERTKHTIGNLTLLHYGLNRGLQNSPFYQKREALFAESNLHLNRSIMMAGSWGENQIEQRGRELFEIAKQIWQGPVGSSEASWLLEAMVQPDPNRIQFPDQTLESIPAGNVAFQTNGSWKVKNSHFPVGTEFRSTYKGRVYKGRVSDGVLVLSDGAEFSSPSAAARHITGTEVNGWTFWECRLPGHTTWQVISTLRR